MAQRKGISRKEMVKRNRQPYTNATALASYLGVRNAAAVEQIMKGCRGGFAMAYRMYYEDYFKPEVGSMCSQLGSTTFTRHKVPKLREVVDALEAGKAYVQWKYREPCGDKHGWKDVDHCARFLYITSDWHQKHCAGLWYEKVIRSHEIYEGIYQRIWQMFLRKNLLRARARKAELARIYNCGGFKFSERIHEESDRAESSEDEKPDGLQTKTIDVCIVYEETEDDGMGFILRNVVNMTYEQLRRKKSRSLTRIRPELRVISLSRLFEGTSITNTNFDNYKQFVPSTKEFDYVKLETAAA